MTSSKITREGLTSNGTSAGINTLAKFVLHARQYHATQVVMKGSHQFPWQEKSLKNFQRLLPRLHLEIE